MITRWILAAILMLGATTAWAQPPAANGTNGTPAATTPDTTNPDNTPAPDNSAATDEEAGTADTSGPVTATDKIVNRFMALDTDASEGVSFDEYMTMVQQRAQDRFKSMDANGDGEVTADEYRQFWQSRMSQLYRLNR